MNVQSELRKKKLELEAWFKGILKGDEVAEVTIIIRKIEKVSIDIVKSAVLHRNLPSSFTDEVSDDEWRVFLEMNMADGPDEILKLLYEKRKVGVTGKELRERGLNIYWLQSYFERKAPYFAVRVVNNPARELDKVYKLLKRKQV